MKNKEKKMLSQSEETSLFHGHKNQTIISLREHESQTVLHEKKMKKYTHGDKPAEYPENSSYISISNTSLRGVEEEEDEEEELSLRAMFNYKRMINIFENYQMMAAAEDVDFLPDTLEFCKEIFDNLTLHDNEIAEKLYDSVMIVDPTYPRRFVEFAHINNPNSGFLMSTKSKARDHLVRQFKKILEYHRMTIDAFLNDEKEAQKLVHLMGLSHYLMKIPVRDFDMLSLAKVKLLLHLGICNEENIIHIIAYLCTLTKGVRKEIEEYQRGQEHLLIGGKLKSRLEQLRVYGHEKSDTSALSDEMLSQQNLASIFNQGGTINIWARRNYREMKDWHLVQVKIRRNVILRNPLAMETRLYMERPNTEDIADTITEGRPSTSKELLLVKPLEADSRMVLSDDKCFLKWLKKGYKFKKKDDNLSAYKQHHF